MKHLTLFPSIEYLEAYCEQIDEIKDNADLALKLRSIGKMLPSKQSQCNDASGTDRPGITNFSKIFWDFWNYFYNELRTRPNGREDSFWRIIPKETLLANFVLSSLYTFLELRDSQHNESAMDVLKQLDQDWGKRTKSELRSLREAFLRANKNEYPNDHHTLTEQERPYKYYFANAYVDIIMEDDSDLSSIKIRGYDKILPLQIVLNQHLDQGRIGSTYDKKSTKHKRTTKRDNPYFDEAKPISELIRGIYSEAPIEEKVSGFFEADNKELKQRVKNSKGKLKEAILSLSEIAKWENPLAKEPYDIAVYQYERELIFHVNALMSVLQCISDDMAGSFEFIRRLLVIACLNPMIIKHEEVLVGLFNCNNSMDAIEEQICFISNEMWEFCGQLYYIMGRNLDVCIKNLRNNISLAQHLFLDKNGVLVGFSEKPISEEENAKRIIANIYNSLPSIDYQEKVSDFYGKIWSLIVSIMTPYEHNSPKGLETQFILLRTHDWQNTVDQNILDERIWKARGLKEWIKTPEQYMTVPNQWQCDAMPLIDMCEERGYADKTIQALIDLILKDGIEIRQRKVNTLRKLVDECESEDELIDRLTQESISDDADE